MPTPNATHRKRLARKLAEQTGMTYMAALDAVTKAATAGRLPQRLDDAGMAAAVRMLSTDSAIESVTVPGLLVPPAPRRASDPRDQQIYDLSAYYEAATGKQGLIYIESPGSGKDRYVFGGRHIALGREEALAHVAALVAQVRAERPGVDPTVAPRMIDGECQHVVSEYRSQQGTFCADCNEPLMSYDQLVAADRFHLERPYLAVLRQVWQGRVAWEVTGTRNPAPRFTIDDKPASDLKDLELRWLHDNDYITTPPLLKGEEWAVARTTDWGDDVLAFHGADVDKFRDGLPEPKEAAFTNGTVQATVRGLLRVRDEFVKVGRVEWWWHAGPFAGSHGFKIVEGVDPEDGSLVLRDEDPQWMEPHTRLTLDYIDDPDKAARHLMWADHTGVTLCDKKTGQIDATYRVARTEPRIFTLKRSDIQRCPIKSLEVGHYREDGTCRCPSTPAGRDLPEVREPKPGSNEAIRQQLERSAQISDRISGWFKTQMNAKPKPVRWEWVDKEGLRDSMSEIDVTYDDGSRQTHMPADFPDANTILDRNVDRLIGGPTTATVYQGDTNRRGTPRCDICNRHLAANEPWWMVRSPNRGWENAAGVVCGMHHPDRLPHETVSKATSR